MIIFFIIVALVALWLWSTYNNLVKTSVRVDEAWSDITVQLKRRFDLIPNLVSTVKGYAKHEKQVFENVTKARAAVMQSAEAGDVKEAAKNENMFSATLKSLFAVAENYPELKADKNFRQLQTDLTDTENKIQAARRFYNGAARDLNIKVKQFPANLVARLFGFKERDFFEVEDRGQVEKAPEVNFDK